MVQLNLALKEKQKKPKPYFIKIQFFDWHTSFCELERVSGKIFHNMNIRHLYVVKLLDCVLQKIYGLTTKFINAK